MDTKKLYVLGVVLALTICMGVSSVMANDDPCEGLGDCCMYGCSDDCDFTTEFRLQSCRGFRTIGINPYFIMKPGYQLVLEGEDEDDEGEVVYAKEVVTVLCDTKWIKLNGRWIKTRVIEERAFECEDEEYEECETIEISLNWFAICNRTNAVYYFGEDSRECEGGFDENNECPRGVSDEGSWEAGVDGAEPGLIMPGTPLLGAKYFQEIAEEQDAVDRGEVLDVGLPITVPAGSWSGCIEIGDTNPAEGECDPEDDLKIYCPGVGVVQDQELKLVERAFVGCEGYDHHCKR